MELACGLAVLGEAPCAQTEEIANDKKIMAATARENQAQALREMGVLVSGLFPGWKNRDGTE
jgi:hypothetical protein